MSLREHIEQSRAANSSAVTRQELENKNAEELFAITLAGEYDDDFAWEAVSVLRLRGTPEVFELAKRFCNSDDPKARARGLSVLAQLGAGKPDAERPFVGESVSIAIDHLADRDIEVLRSAAWALSFLGTEPGVAALRNMRDHPDPNVRLAVASCIELRGHPNGINTLLHLMEDCDDEVRDWATFSIGSEELSQAGVEGHFDTPEIRAALKRRLSDHYEEARREAIWGLARRKDPIGIELLIQALDSEDPWSGDQDAAEELLGLERGRPVSELVRELRTMVDRIHQEEISQ
jgi:HEAT repeat protein